MHFPVRDGNGKRKREALERWSVGYRRLPEPSAGYRTAWVISHQ